MKRNQLIEQKPPNNIARSLKIAVPVRALVEDRHRLIGRTNLHLEVIRFGVLALWTQH